MRMYDEPSEELGQANEDYVPTRKVRLFNMLRILNNICVTSLIMWRKFDLFLYNI